MIKQTQKEGKKINTQRNKDLTKTKRKKKKQPNKIVLTKNIKTKQKKRLIL